MIERLRLRWWRRDEFRTARSDRGDTLVELLVAISIVSIAVVPLIGTLALSLSGAAEHRNLATIDTLLRSFAETAKSELQINATSTFSDSNTTYQLLSQPDPASGPTGTAVTIFGTGFHPNVAIASFTVTIGLTALTTANNGISASQSESSSDANGNMQVTFFAPSGITGDAIQVSDGSGTSVSTIANTGFTVTTGQTPVTTSPLHGYTMGIPDSTTSPPGIEYWNASSGTWSTSSVSGSGLQLITLKASSPSGISDTLSFVLRNQADAPTPVPTPLVTVTPSNASNTLPATGTTTLTFTATVQPSSTNPTPTGTVSWSIGTTPQVTTPSCTSKTSLTASTGNSATATCTLSLTSASMVGTYTATATYSGDAYNSSANNSGFAVVMGTPLVTVTFNNPTVTGQTATFTATIAPPASADPAPTGTLTWSFGGTTVPSNANTTNCPTTTLPSNSTGSQTATCSFTAQTGIWSYTATATYNGDVNFNAATGTDTVTYTVTTSSKQNPTLSMSYATGGSGSNKTLTFMLTVSGSVPPTPTGTVTWSNLSPGSLPSSCSTGGSLVASTGNSATESCTISSVSPSTTYTITATYSGDTIYNGGSAPGSHAG